MITGDNLATAVAIAQDAGILTEGGVAIEGPKFRSLSREEMVEVLPRLQVRATPQLVQYSTVRVYLSVQYCSLVVDPQVLILDERKWSRCCLDYRYERPSSSSLTSLLD